MGAPVSNPVFQFIIIGSIALECLGIIIGQTDKSAILPAAILICFATMLLFASRVIPEYMAALLFFVTCALGGIAPPAVFLAGFTGPAVWLVISGAIIGTAMHHTGLAQRLGRRLAGRNIRGLPSLIIRVAVFSAALVFIMPSAMGRILLLLPMLEAVAAAAGLAPGDRRATGILLAGVFATFFPAMAVLPANVPNNVMAGLMETTGLGPLSFTSYLILHFPVLGLIKLGLIIGVLLFTYRGGGPLSVTIPPDASARPWAASEKRLAFVLGATILLWVSDGWHGVPTAWVGMLAAIMCLWPRGGLMPETGLRAVGLEPVFYVAGVIGIGAVLGHSGAADRLAALVAGLVGLIGSTPTVTLFALVAIMAVLGLLVMIVAIPAIVTPISQGLATATGLSVEMVTMSQVIAFSTVFFPYQAPPLAIAGQAKPYIRRDMARLCLILALLSVLIIWPLDLLWWRLLGALG